ncbi:MAG: hypothetical protein ACRED8_10080, partial [Caulobacteraceae bacterium]
QGGLQVETAPASGRLSPKHPLRCFVGGVFVGELPLEACARRNVVATGALDVGLDPNGALAGAGAASAEITPLPPASGDTAAAPPATTAPPVSANQTGPASPLATCWRYEEGSWSVLPTQMNLSTCVRSLYAGRCERPGEAAYGRWGARTLRLITGEVESSPDNRHFSTLALQGPSCSLTGLD